MAVGKGLAGIRKAKEEAAARREAMNSPKVEWFSLKGRPNGAKVVFLQELDEDGKNYDATRGTVITVVEHQAPGREGWKARAMCTIEDEGQCFACERHRENPTEGWKAKTNLYVNVLDEDGKVKVLSRNVNNAFVDNLIEWFSETNSITENAFKLKEMGEGFNRTWTLTPSPQALPDMAVELYDLEKAVVRKVAYGQQADYYGKAYSGPEKEGSPSSATEDESLAW